MNNKLKILIIFSITLILFIPLFLRGIPSFGMDSYAFINYIYGISPALPPNTPVLATTIFNILPANLFVIWGLIFCIMFSTLLIWKKIGELYSKAYGWLAPLILLSSPFFLQMFFRLEDDLLAIPFLSLAFYFGYKYQKIINETGMGYFRYVLLTLLMILVSGLFWKFSIYYIFLFLIITKFNPLFLFPTLGAIFIFQEKLIFGILPSLTITENYPVVGIFGLGFILIYFLKDFRTKDLEDWFVIFLLFMNLKFIFLAVPVLTVKLIQGINKVRLKHTLKLIKVYVVGVSVFILVGGWLLLSATPSNDIDELFSIAYTIKEHINNEEPILANWDFGYYFGFWDKEQKKFFGNPNNDIKNYKGHIIISNLKNQQSDICKKAFENNIGKILIC